MLASIVVQAALKLAPPCVRRRSSEGRYNDGFSPSRTAMELITFAGQHPHLDGAAAALAAMIVYTEVRRLTRGFVELGLVQAVQLVNADAVVVDVRPPERFQSGHIGGARAAGELSKQDFRKVYNLRGGLEAWRRESYPLERK